MEQLFLRGAKLFHFRKCTASQITPNKSPKVEQVPTMPILLDCTQEATPETPPVVIVTIPTTALAAPIIQVIAVREIVTEQEVLSDIEVADESD
jgi:hypothetical protein